MNCGWSGTLRRGLMVLLGMLTLTAAQVQAAAAQDPTAARPGAPTAPASIPSSCGVIARVDSWALQGCSFAFGGGGNIETWINLECVTANGVDTRCNVFIGEGILFIDGVQRAITNADAAGHGSVTDAEIIIWNCTGTHSVNENGYQITVGFPNGKVLTGRQLIVSALVGIGC